MTFTGDDGNFRIKDVAAIVLLIKICGGGFQPPKAGKMPAPRENQIYI